MPTHPDGLRWENITLFPSIDASAAYDKNIALSESRPRKDYIGFFRPTLIGTLGFGSFSSLNLTYYSDFQQYSRTKAFNTRNNFVSLGGRIGPPEGYYLASSTYVKTNDRTPTLTERVDREETFWQLGAGRMTDSFQGEALVQQFQRLYGERLRPLEYRALSFAPRGTILLDDYRRLLADAKVERLHYLRDDKRSGPENQLRVGGEYGDMDYPLVHVIGGLKSRQFNGANLGRFYGLVGEAGGNLHYEGKTILEGLLSTDAFDSLAEPNSGYYREYRARVGAIYKQTSKLTWTGSQSLARQRYGGSSSNGRRRDRVDLTNLRGDYGLNVNWSVYLGINLEHRKSNAPQQSYNEFSTIFGTRFAI